MEYANRSLWFAVLACLAMGLYAKSPEFMGGQLWVSAVFFFSTLALSSTGLWYGIKGARQQRTFWSILGPFINGFLLLSFLAFNLLLFRALSGLK